MIENNVKFLHDSLLYLGFGVNTPIHHELEEKIKQEPETFELDTEAFFDEESRMEARLHFKAGSGVNAGMYYLNRYDASLHYLNDPARTKTQTFKIARSRIGITFKEAFNLLQGRYVYKNMITDDGERYLSWIRLDLDNKSISGNYWTRKFYDRFDIKRALHQCPIRELGSDELEERLIRSLRKGNLHQVTYKLASGKYEKKFIWANPDMNTISNISVATRAAGKGGVPVTLTDLPEVESDNSEPLSDSALREDWPARARAAHL